MTRRWKDLDRSGRTIAGTVYGALHQAAELLDPADGVATGVSRSVLWAHASGRTKIGENRLASMLAGDPRSRADYEAMLARACLTWGPRVAAAASGGPLVERRGDGFVLRLLPSRFDQDQTFVMIVLDRPGSPPSRLVVLTDDGAPVEAVLPAPVDGVIQMLSGSGSPLMRSLTDPEARVYLLRAADDEGPAMRDRR